MDTLRKLQHEFFGYLRDHSALDIVQRIESSDGRTAEQRMQIYGNAYNLRLKEALGIDYERLHSYVGDELFELLTDRYIQNYPSQQPNLRYFGQYMVALVEHLEPFSGAPEVTEIARIERAFGNSFDAADCPGIQIDQLAQLEPEKWATLSLGFHDAVQLLPQKFNSFQIWKALANGEAPPDKTSAPSTWLIWRQDLVSRYRSLDTPELAALNIALSGGSFADICEILLEHFAEAEIPLRAVSYLKLWINDQMVCRLS